ncbi:hypothetical protein LJ737_25620 [Hymenobacter sp. 15J16-1T3B]|uniref:hypothetical protein n=1 Tax=Hymenobacter sp. 15J16-1T3B TaxID=2886941 RepID=UPI001D0F86ED|nr:hypothetical protein [Hymenobacter sp. 15J16-1T3B]MCC3160643.1 hypothetical protein [Hymenobacter sp. 15J16-1T3B]
MANYNQHPDEDRDYRGRNQNYANQNRDWNNRFDDNRRGQQRWQDQDDNTRGVSGNDGYSSGSSADNRRDWDRNSWHDDSRQNRASYGNQQSYGQSRQQEGVNRGGTSDRRNVGNYQAPADYDARNHNGYGSSYGQQAYTSGSDPDMYGRGDRNNSWQQSSAGRSGNRYEQDRDARPGNRYGSSDRYSSNSGSSYGQYGQGRSDSYGRRTDDYSQNFYDADENSRYRTIRGSHDEDDRHDRDEHRGFFGRMADRVSHLFSDDDDRDDRRDWQDRDQRRSY